MKKIFCSLLIMLLASSLYGVEIINNSSTPVNLVEFSLISGKEIDKKMTLAPGAKYKESDIASFDIYFSAHKIKYHLKELEDDSVVTCETINNNFMVYKTDTIKPDCESF